jgi:hypothetical protein
MHRTTIALVIAAAFALASLPASAAPTPPGVIATFDGHTINLADGWGAARACTSDGVTARCYRSEAEMDAAEGGLDDGFAPYACSGSLRLYRSTSYGGAVLQLTTQYTLINLATYSFNNDTSSYRVGPCASIFYDTTTGSGTYPGNTGANVSAPSMSAGWDNRIGSVYIS